MVCYHLPDKPGQQGGVDKDDQIRSEESHDEPGRMVQMIGQNEEIDPENKEESPQNSKNDLFYPPIDACHRNLNLTDLKGSTTLL